MCFSATASFTAAIVIGAVGVVTLKSCKKPNDRYFAAIPILFALQQLTEGFVWLSSTQPAFAPIQDVAANSFLFFGWVLWPVLMPLAIYKLESDPLKQKINFALILFGMSYGIYAIYKLSANQIIPYIVDFHISYKFDINASEPPIPYGWQAVYVLVSVLPLFISSVKGTKMLAIANMVSLLIVYIFFTQVLLSVWCFFAAILSGIIYFILKRRNKYVPLTVSYIQK